MLFNPKNETLTLECSKCGAKATAGCKCGAAYLPKSELAARAVAANPEKSDRLIAAEIGVSDWTVGQARKSSTPRNLEVHRRQGRDGRWRMPKGEAQRLIARAIVAHPAKSNSAIAKELGLDRSTVCYARKAIANPKPPRKGKKNDALAAEAAAKLVLDTGMTHEQAGKETGAGSELLVRVAVAREEGRREAEGAIDPKTLSLTSQQKLEAAIRQAKRKLDIEFEQRVLNECRKRIEETILPGYNKSHAHYEAVIKARKGIMDRASYRKILSCLHPDRVSDPALKKRYEEAFHLFTKLEQVVLNEKESPTTSFRMPRTYEELMALKQKVSEERKRARASNGVSVRH